MPTEDGKLNMNDLTMIMDAKNMAQNANDKAESVMRTLSEQNKPTNGELAIMIANVKGMIEQGFAGVHERQDRTNGRIMKAENKINKLENWRWYLVGGGSVILFCFGIAIKFIK